MMKLMIFGRRRGGMTVAQLHRYMEAVHGAMVVRLTAEAPALRELQAPGSLVVLLAREKVMVAGADAVA